MWRDAEKHLSEDKYIGPLIEKWGHCTIKPLKKSQYFTDLVDAICSQQLSGKAAKTIFGRVKTFLGKITPENILLADTEDLRKCGLSYAKCKYVKDLSEKVKRQEVKVERLNKLSDEEVISELTKVKGIGRWTAEMFLIFSLARQDIFPNDDLGISKSVNQLFNKSVNKDEMEKISERWKPYRTVASWYLWREV